MSSAYEHRMVVARRGAVGWTLSRTLSLGAILAALTAGCTSPPMGDPEASQSPAPRPPPVSSPVSTPVSTMGETAPAASGIPSPHPTATPPAAHQGPLAHFHDALRALETGNRKRHVHVMWLGDSHAQADFWPNAIRDGLQRRFGNAGPGFVHIGFKAYRHAEIKTDLMGKWRFRPKQPSTIEPWGDGAFGLGGILHAGYAERRKAKVILTDEGLAGRRIAWDLCYKFGLPQDKVVVSVGDAAPVTLAANGKDDVGRLRHLELASDGLASIEVDIKAGRTDFCGLKIETDAAQGKPGVVLDNLGINGARYATPLAWNEEAWKKEVERRIPELVIFEYGGNEASDWTITPKKYKQNALDLIARVRRIAPETSCLVIGPSDRADAEAKIPPINDAIREAAAEAKCMFWNTYDKMGGKGSLRRWRDDERAAEDGVHLKPKGYAEVGALLLADIMADYQRP